MQVLEVTAKGAVAAIKFLYPNKHDPSHAMGRTQALVLQYDDV
jgi:hypothetical protein